MIRNSIKQVEWYSEKQCEEHPECLYVFGDNLINKGKGGQAQIRDCKNALGIPTKRYPSMEEGSFFSDQPDEITAVEEAINSIVDAYNEGSYECIVFPDDGLGTGLAEMPSRSPKLFARMNLLIYMIFGIAYNTHGVS